MTENWLHIGVEMGAERMRLLGPSLPVTLRAPGTDVEHEALALIDPGAGMSAVHAPLAAFLDCPILEDVWTVHIANHVPADCKVIAPALRFEKGPEIQMQVAIIEQLGDPHELLIGRDLLSLCRLDTDFVAGRFDLHVGLHLLKPR